MKSADLQDALADFNSAEIKNAMADSDLKGLTQIKSALDEQNTKNSVEFFNQNKQPMQKLIGASSSNGNSSTSEISLSQLSEEFKEAERGYGNDLEKPTAAAANTKTSVKDVAVTKSITTTSTVSSDEKAKVSDGSKDVKESASAIKDSNKKDGDSTQETIKQITENAEKFFSGANSLGDKNTKANEKDTLGTVDSKKPDDIARAASLVQTLIKQDSTMDIDGSKQRDDETEKFLGGSSSENKASVSDYLIERILKSRAFQRFFEKKDEGETQKYSNSNKNEDVTSAITGSTRSSPTHTWREVGAALLTTSSSSTAEPTTGASSEDNPENPTYKAFVKSVHEEALNGDKLQGAEGTMESFTKGDSKKLQINGGRVIGGNSFSFLHFFYLEIMLLITNNRKVRPIRTLTAQKYRVAEQTNRVLNTVGIKV